jgi:hypothetical protein
MAQKEDATAVGEAIDAEPVGEESRVGAPVSLAFDWVIANLAVEALGIGEDLVDVFHPDVFIFENDRDARPEDILGPPLGHRLGALRIHTGADGFIFLPSAEGLPLFHRLVVPPGPSSGLASKISRSGPPTEVSIIERSRNCPASPMRNHPKPFSQARW